ncbi:MAG: hypothetical protein KIT82_20015 [Bradyrhizobium sp.]|nr:hypothetical protein [Bradyrhizobium sp.]
MADEAFALSPISARAAQPSEEDYAAIHEAFMETSRGRWFLGEYAKRNRNADTRMVLDAVARIEGSLAAQKQAAAAAELNEALAAIRAAVSEAQVTANDGLDGLAFDERLAPIARGVRIIREISWRWRETGADSRICDILDSQTAAIEASTGGISVAEARVAIDRAFAAIEARIDEYSPGEAKPAEALRSEEDANIVPFPAAAEEAAADGVFADVAEVPAAETARAATTDAVESTAEAAAPIDDIVGMVETVDEAAADAQDEAVLDLIAAEMSAPQPMDDELAVAETAMIDVEIAGPEIAEAVLHMAEAVAAPEAPSAEPEAPIAAATTPPSQPTQIGEAEASIGAAVIASGILKKPAVPANDPLAPIRRMSQAERLAFFS